MTGYLQANIPEVSIIRAWKLIFALGRSLLEVDWASLGTDSSSVPQIRRLFASPSCTQMHAKGKQPGMNLTTRWQIR
jgi:hypothetical protein